MMPNNGPGKALLTAEKREVELKVETDEMDGSYAGVEQAYLRACALMDDIRPNWEHVAEHSPDVMAGILLCFLRIETRMQCLLASGDKHADLLEHYLGNLKGMLAILRLRAAGKKRIIDALEDHVCGALCGAERKTHAEQDS